MTQFLVIFSEFTSKLLDLNKTKIDSRLCHKNKRNKFCCDFSIEFAIEPQLISKTQYVYHLVVYKGYKDYYQIFEPGGIEVCALVACLGDKLSTCGKKFPKYDSITWPITFKKIHIKAGFDLPYKERIYYSSQFPNSLLSSFRPIHPDLTIWTKRTVLENKTEKLERSFELKAPQDRILTFGIFGRNFSYPGDRRKTSKGCCLTVIKNFFWLTLLICILIY